MNALVLLCGVLVAGVADPAKTSEDDLHAYQEAKAQAKRDPAAHVRLALWCEAHGLEAERLKHLAIAVVADPRNATARGLMGLVSFEGQWRRPADVAEKVKSDAQLAATLAEYNAKREKTANIADAQWKLALWCEEKGLRPEATAHFTAVTRLDPGREAAWKHLGCKKHNGRWMTAEQIAAEKADIEAQKKADKHWKPLLEKWREWLGHKERRAEAERQLAGVTDPRAVPSGCAVFGSTDAKTQARLVQLLGQVDSPAASRGLAMLAVFSQSDDVRRSATETLKRRDVRTFASLLIGLFRDPLKYEIRPVAGPGSPGVLFVEGERLNVRRLYMPPGVLFPPILPGSWLGYDAYGLPVLHYTRENQRFGPRITADKLVGVVAQQEAASAATTQALASMFSSPAQFVNGLSVLAAPHPAGPYMAPGVAHQLAGQISHVQKTEHKPLSAFGFSEVISNYTDTQVPIGQMMLEAQRTAIVAQQQLQSDVAAVDSYNQAIDRWNDHLNAVLNNASGQDLAADREAWRAWWINQLGYAYSPPPKVEKPTITENVPLLYQAQPVLVTTSVSASQVTGFQRMSCFAAGTLVRTISGNVPIEKLAVGDQVLTQDTKTGALSYQPILVVHHNPPSKTFKITLNDEPVISSQFHRFWKAGHGWVMARDLKVGDTIRTLEGLAKVTEFETDQVQPVYNLDVAETASFFVGQLGALVHDNSLPAPAAAPFDAEPVLAASGTNAGGPPN